MLQSIVLINESWNILWYKTQLTWRWTWFRVCDRWARWDIINKWLIETIEETLKVTITSNSRRPNSDSSLRDKKISIVISKKSRFFTFFDSNTLLKGACKNVEYKQYWNAFWMLWKTLKLAFMPVVIKKSGPRQSKMWN